MTHDDEVPSDLASVAQSAFAPRVQFVAEVGSTNDAAIGLALAGAPEGTVVLADTQRRGRGRFGRSWFSPLGAGVYLSLIRRPRDRGEWPLMTLTAGVAAAQAIVGATGLPVELKWPNDLVVGRPWRKLAGVLCESVTVGPQQDAIVVGIGVNVRASALPPELAERVTSIETELGRSIDRGPVVVRLLEELDREFARLRAGDRDAIRASWRAFARAGFEHGAIRWHDQGMTRTGLARDIDDEGALIVEADGRRDIIRAGEVTWERLSRD